MSGHWGFVAAAYGVTLIATLGLALHALLAMRAAEKRAAATRQPR